MYIKIIQFNGYCMCYRWMERPSKPKYGIQRDRSDTEQLPQRKFGTKLLMFSHRVSCVCVCVCVYRMCVFMYVCVVCVYTTSYVCVCVCVCIYRMYTTAPQWLNYVYLVNSYTYRLFFIHAAQYPFFPPQNSVFFIIFFWFIKYSHFR